MFDDNRKKIMCDQACTFGGSYDLWLLHMYIYMCLYYLCMHITWSYQYYPSCDCLPETFNSSNLEDYIITSRTVFVEPLPWLMTSSSSNNPKEENSTVVEVMKDQSNCNMHTIRFPQACEFYFKNCQVSYCSTNINCHVVVRHIFCIKPSQHGVKK